MVPSIKTIIIILFVLVMIVVIDSIYRRLKPFIFARRGEVMAAIRLLMLPSDKYKVLNSVLLKTNWGNCQIDHVIVSSFGIFVLEIKNCKGTIYGGDNSEKWTRFLKKRKYELVNPIKQNANHIKVLKEFLRVDCPFYSVIVFNNKAKVRSNAETALLTKQKDLIEDIKKQNAIVLSRDEVEEIADKIKQYSVGFISSTMKRNKKARVDIKRRVFSVSDDICPECGAKLTIRKSEYGEFLSCSNYPKCNYSHRFIL